jgi:hypothetical protein
MQNVWVTDDVVKSQSFGLWGKANDFNFITINLHKILSTPILYRVYIWLQKKQPESKQCGEISTVISKSLQKFNPDAHVTGDGQQEVQDGLFGLGTAGI